MGSYTPVQIEKGVLFDVALCKHFCVTFSYWLTTGISKQDDSDVLSRAQTGKFPMVRFVGHPVKITYHKIPPSRQN